MYARIENGVAVEFPLFEGDLANRFPDLLFPMDTHNTPIPEGYVRVVGVSMPFDLANTYEIAMPTIQNGEWTMNWTATPRSDAEKAAILKDVEQRVRNDRNERLAKCDWTQLVDSPVNAAPWATYRQVLRDVTSQSGFPWEVVWPNPPQ